MATIEYNIVNTIKNAKRSREFNHLAIDLITLAYDPATLAIEASRSGINYKLGYLADVTARAARNKGLLEESSKLHSLVKKLHLPDKNEWEFLNPNAPDFAKRILLNSPRDNLNNKWKIYANLTPAEIEDWIDLYVTQEYASTLRR